MNITEAKVDYCIKDKMMSLMSLRCILELEKIKNNIFEQNVHNSEDESHVYQKYFFGTKCTKE